MPNLSVFPPSASLRCGLLVAGVVTFLVAPGVRATTYAIATLNDGIADDGDCTLREALVAARTDVAQDLCPAGSASDEIVLATVGTYDFSLGHEELDVELSQLTVRGADATQRENYVVDLGGANRFLMLTGGAELSLRDFVIRNGDVRLDPNNAEGGALFVGDASATLENLAIESSKAESGGGVAFHGIFLGSLVLRDVDFVANEVTSPVAFAGSMGGGLSVVRMDAESTVVLRDVSFQANRARAEVANSNAYGAGLSFWLRNAGSGDLQRLVFAGNQLLGGGEGGLGGAAFSIFLDDYETNPVYPNLAVRDVHVESSALLGTTESSQGLAIELVALYGVTANLDRIELRANGPSAIAPEIHVLSQSANVTLSNVLAVNGPSRGLEVDQQGGGSVLLGNITASGHSSEELALSNSGPGTVRLENSIAWGDGVGDAVFNGTIDVAAENLIGIDPQFVAPGSGDYELTPSSPAVDAGDASFASAGPLDALHRPRLAGLEIDLGALERRGLFGDGFEAGDAGAWSAVQP